MCFVFLFVICFFPNQKVIYDLYISKAWTTTSIRSTEKIGRESGSCESLVVYQLAVMAELDAEAKLVRRKRVSAEATSLCSLFSRHGFVRFLNAFGTI